MKRKNQLRSKLVLACIYLYSSSDLGLEEHYHGRVSVSAFSSKPFLSTQSCRRRNSHYKQVPSRLYQSTLEKKNQEIGEDDTSSTNAFDKAGEKKSPTLSDRIANSGMASAATLATAAVNAAVAMRTLEAPDVSKSYVAMDETNAKSKSIELDKDGLPLVYDKDAIERYWRKERGALNQRWGYFVGKTVPFLTKMVALFIKDGKIDEKYIPELSEQARIDLQDLGPTFIKVRIL